MNSHTIYMGFIYPERVRGSETSGAESCAEEHAPSAVHVHVLCCAALPGCSENWLAACASVQLPHPRPFSLALDTFRWPCLRLLNSSLATLADPNPGPGPAQEAKGGRPANAVQYGVVIIERFFLREIYAGRPCHPCVPAISLHVPVTPRSWCLED